jgi:hypothetical protein
VSRSELIWAIKLPVPCPYCSKEFTQAVAWLNARTQTPCTYCDRPIDLSSKEWRAYVGEFAKACEHLQVPYGELR